MFSEEANAVVDCLSLHAGLGPRVPLAVSVILVCAVRAFIFNGGVLLLKKIGVDVNEFDWDLVFGDGLHVPDRSADYHRWLLPTVLSTKKWTTG